MFFPQHSGCCHIPLRRHSADASFAKETSAGARRKRVSFSVSSKYSLRGLSKSSLKSASKELVDDVDASHRSPFVTPHERSRSLVTSRTVGSRGRRASWFTTVIPRRDNHASSSAATPDLSPQSIAASEGVSPFSASSRTSRGLSF